MRERRVTNGIGALGPRDHQREVITRSAYVANASSQVDEEPK